MYAYTRAYHNTIIILYIIMWCVRFDRLTPMLYWSSGWVWYTRRLWRFDRTPQTLRRIYIYIIYYYISYRKTCSQIKLLNRLRRASGVYYDLCVSIKVVVARAHARPPLRLQTRSHSRPALNALVLYIYICDTSWARNYYYYYLRTHTHTHIYILYTTECCTREEGNKANITGSANIGSPGGRQWNKFFSPLPIPPARLHELLRSAPLFRVHRPSSLQQHNIVRYSLPKSLLYIYTRIHIKYNNT